MNVGARSSESRRHKGEGSHFERRHPALDDDRTKRATNVSAATRSHGLQVHIYNIFFSARHSFRRALFIGMLRFGSEAIPAVRALFGLVVGSWGGGFWLGRGRKIELCG